MNLDSVTLQCFIAVAETRSFTKAANRIGRTQSAVSQQIAKLENYLDKPLFNRGRELTLTPDGELFLSYAKRIYELHRESIDRFKSPELKGKLTFGLPEDFATTILSDVLLEFRRLHPRVMLNVHCDLTLNLIERYKKGEFDLILIKMNQDYDMNKLVTVWNEPVDWVGKKDLLPALDETTSIPLVLSPSPCVYRGNVIDALDKCRLNWQLVYSSPSYTGKMAAVRAGLGITAIQRSLTPNYLDHLDLSFLPPLNDVQVSLLKKFDSNKAVDSLEYFILQKLKH